MIQSPYKNIISYINNINNNYKKPKWQGGKMNVLIPMAGAGSRFEKAGYTFPKPLIDVRGKPMIQWVVDNLNVEAKYIFIVQRSHFEKYNLKETLSNFCPNNEIVQIYTIKTQVISESEIEFLHNYAEKIGVYCNDMYLKYNEIYIVLRNNKATFYCIN